MNWRRGLMFALFHLSIAVPLIIWQDAEQWRQMRSGSTPASAMHLAAFQDQVVPFERATICYFTTSPELIVRYVNLPASILAGWHYPKRSVVTVAGVSESLFGHFSRRSTVATAFGFVLLIFMQWICVGSVAVIRPKHHWLDPMVVITACGVLSTMLVLVLPPHDDRSTIPLVLVVLAWFVWGCAALLKLLKVTWGAAHRPRT